MMKTCHLKIRVESTPGMPVPPPGYTMDPLPGLDFEQGLDAGGVLADSVTVARGDNPRFAAIVIAIAQFTASNDLPGLLCSQLARLDPTSWAYLASVLPVQLDDDTLLVAQVLD